MTYKPGRLNNDADCLSRPFSGTAREETPTVSVINASDDPKRVVWEEANNDDDDGPGLPDFDKHEEYIGPHSFIGGSLPTVTEMCKAQLADETLKKIRADLREPFYISDNDLLRLHPVGPRATHCPVAVPLCMRQRVLFYFHGAEMSAHMGAPKCYAIMSNAFGGDGCVKISNDGSTPVCGVLRERLLDHLGKVIYSLL